MDIQKILKKLDINIYQAIVNNLKNEDIHNITEIRLRVNNLITVRLGNEKKVVSTYIVTSETLYKTILKLSKNSIYSIEEELKSGFFTVEGGHRIGIAGKIVVENNKIKKICEYSSVNIRIAKEIIGISDNIMRYIMPLKNVLILSPPYCGKTTMLRDICRNISSAGYNTVIIDERSEICSSYNGVPQCEIGNNTDVLDNCPKHMGLNIAIRTLAPEVIAVDEIGTQEDIQGIMNSFNSGVKIIGTVHAYDIKEFLNKSNFEYISKLKLFDLYIQLGIDSNNKRYYKMYNKEYKEMLI